MKVLRPVIAFGALVLLASPAMGQDRYALIDVRAGYTKAPTGDDSDLNLGQSLKSQSSFGLSAFIALSNKVRLGPSFDFAHHSVKQPPDGEIIGGPNDQQYKLFHAFLKVSFDLVNSSRVSVALNAGPGMIFFAPNDILRAQGIESDRHFAVNGGASITWWFSERIGLLLSPQVDVALSRSSGQIFTDKSALFIPLTGGLRFKI